VFRTEMHNYLLKGEPHFANALNPSIPSALADVVVGLTHLDNFRPKAKIKDHLKSTGHFLVQGEDTLAPADFKVIYDFPSGLDGTGQSIVIVGQSALNTTGSGAGTAYTDIDAFRTKFSLPARTATNFSATLVPNTGASPGVLSGDVDESNLDLEWSAAIATGANVIFFYAGVNGSAFDAIVSAIDNKSAPIISSSYGNCESVFTAAQVQQLIVAGQQANAQGQTVVAAVGDQGAADCDTSPALPAQGGLAVDIPAALPYVTGVGGTEFNGDVSSPSTYWNTSGAALKYIPETTWNDTASVAQLDATGGGASSLFAKPNWQAGTGVPNDGARDVPDIALSASNEHDPYAFCTGGVSPCVITASPTSQGLAGGTSFGAPIFAGIVALLNQKVSATGGQGNINPTLYSLAANTPSAFHDITTGNNIVPCGSGTPNCPTSGTLQYGYSAGTGYDQVTGLGSLDVGVLASSWAGAMSTTADFHIYGEVSSIAAPGGTTTSTIIVDGVHGFNSAVSLAVSCPSSAFITCTLSSSSITPTGTSNTASATLTIATQAAALDPRNAPLWLSGGGAIFASVFLFGISGWRRRWRVGALLLVAAFLSAAVGCGGSSSGSGSKGTGTPAGTYVVTVTGTSGSTTHTTNIQVTVI
jgi:subtilase family serine protease